jgi:hypothetical protein
MERLLQRGRDVGELAVEGRADRVHGRNTHDRNASRDQAVFDCGRTGLVLEKPGGATQPRPKPFAMSVSMRLIARP